MNKRYMKKRINNRKSVLIIYLVVIPMIMCLVELIAQHHILETIRNLIAEKNHLPNGVMETSILETIMSTISIAVSVWIGLNIYNVYKKEDVDEMLQALDVALDEVLYEGQKRNFIWQLEKGEYMYEISRYLCDEFERSRSIPIEILDILAGFEKKFFLCFSAYESNRQQECIHLAEELWYEVQDIRKCIKNYDIAAHDILKTYINIREADIIFYKNIFADIQSSEEYIKSIKLYDGELKNIPDRNKLLRGYIQNTIGYTYCLLCKMPKMREDKSNETEQTIYKTACYVTTRFLGRKKTREQRKLFEDLAEEYMLQAVENNSKGRYLQNLGSYYEIIKKDYEKALKEYHKALNAEKRDDKTYNLIGALLLKIVDRDLCVDERFNNGKVLLDIAESAETMGNIQDIRKTIEEAYTWLSLGLRIPHPIINTYYNCSKACMYYFLFVQKDDNKLKQAEEYLKVFDIFGYDEYNKAPIGYLYTLRNFYEAKGQYNKAIETNCKIMERKPAGGDAEKAEEVYKNMI